MALCNQYGPPTLALLYSTNRFNSVTKLCWRWSAPNKLGRCPHAACPMSGWFRSRCRTCREGVRLSNPVLHFPTFWQVCSFQFPNANWQGPLDLGLGWGQQPAARHRGQEQEFEKKNGQVKKQKRDLRKELSWKLACGLAQGKDTDSGLCPFT